MSFQYYHTCTYITISAVIRLTWGELVKQYKFSKKWFVVCMTWRLRHNFPCVQRDNTQRAYSRQTESPHRHTCSPRYYTENSSYMVLISFQNELTAAKVISLHSQKLYSYWNMHRTEKYFEKIQVPQRSRHSKPSRTDPHGQPCV